ncbi:MAG: TIGR01777 family oxidoreductase, partial [Prosthecobacter sp.]|nr:TIGR01777 family oxidoreductase [Prosthecobacter sp.]
ARLELKGLKRFPQPYPVSMKIGITGVSGLIGQKVGQLALAAGHEVIGYSRRALSAPHVATRFCQSTAHDVLPETPLDALVHLAGESLLGVWTAAKQRRIWESRVQLTQALVARLATWPPQNRPRVLLCASGIGFYGDRGDEVLGEHSRAGSGFLADLCQAWEAAARQAEALGIRVVLLRTGVVLATEGGAYPLMRLAFRFGLGGRLGSGRQWVSWIHAQDEATLILWAAETESVSGPLNLCAPEPVTNADFTRALAHRLHRPAMLHAPAFALRLLAGGMAREMLLASQRAQPQVAQAQGYRFAYPSLSEALRHLA